MFAMCESQDSLMTHSNCLGIAVGWTYIRIISCAYKAHIIDAYYCSNHKRFGCVPMLPCVTVPRWTLTVSLTLTAEYVFFICGIPFLIEGLFPRCRQHIICILFCVRLCVNCNIFSSLWRRCICPISSAKRSLQYRMVFVLLILAHGYCITHPILSAIPFFIDRICSVHISAQ